ncbi:MAG TPA: TIM-barrel domain-containing protein [Kofleriaceae bacterium]|jgi:alpha-D-xyloside xylohydrolase
MRLALAIVFVCACGDNLAPPAVPLVSGPATITFDGDTLVFARGGQTLLSFGGSAFEAGTVDDLDSGDSFDPYFIFQGMPPATLNWRIASGLRVTSSTPERMVLAVDAPGVAASVTIVPAAPGCFTLTLAATSTTSQSVAILRVRPDADPSEAFYGLGEWGDSVDNRGQLRPMQMEADLNSESADNEDHVPVPLIVGTRGWGMFVPSDRAGAFDVARQSSTLIDVAFATAETSSDGLSVQLLSADQPLDVLGEYEALAGDPAVPAPWAYGPLLWRDENANQAQVIDDIGQIRSRHLAASGIWFDRPYATGVETFDFDPSKFDDPPAMFAALHAAGLRFGVWHAPYVAPAGNGDPAGPENQYATAQNFFPIETGVLVNPWSKPIDFTNAAAYAWWQQNLASYLAAGVEGFKLDYGEDVVVGALGARVAWLFSDGSDERTMHRGYQLLYHRVYRELLDPDGTWLLARTGRWGDQTSGTIIWPGDLDASFAQAGDMATGGKTLVGGLPASLIKNITLSASGFPFYASDTGGYRSSPASEECWVRWVEANAVATAMNIGDASSIQPWENRAADLATYALYTQLHLRLYAYERTYAQQIATTGRPITRAVGLAYPALGQHPSDEYLFGDSLLVAPVVTEGATSRDVLFPPGTWLDWWTGDATTGGSSQSIDAPLATLPLYIAAGAIVPLLDPSIETLAASTDGTPSFANDAGVLDVRVAPGPASSFAAYDGTQLAQAPGSLSYTPGAVFREGARFELIATPPPATVLANGAPLAQAASLDALAAAGSGWFWESATGGTLWILVPGAPATISVPYSGH